MKRFSTRVENGFSYPNKGTDRISVFDFDATAGSLMECPSLAAQLREGTVPRNGVAHPAMPILFVVGELDSTVYALRISQEGRLDRSKSFRVYRTTSSVSAALRLSCFL
ncbi:hypothetical protein CN171_20445 [Sinorhizobium meliloti]|nr:hypothetical protein CN171_20445 [Sinorhizobium meliloti]